MLFIESLVKKCQELLQPLVVAGEQTQNPKQVAHDFPMPEGQTIGDGEFTEERRDCIAGRILGWCKKVHIDPQEGALVGFEIRHSRLYNNACITVALLFGDAEGDRLTSDQETTLELHRLSQG
jgi:hypothetical protein